MASDSELRIIARLQDEVTAPLRALAAQLDVIQRSATVAFTGAANGAASLATSSEQAVAILSQLDDAARQALQALAAPSAATLAVQAEQAAVGFQAVAQQATQAGAAVQRVAQPAESVRRAADYSEQLAFWLGEAAKPVRQIPQAQGALSAWASALDQVQREARDLTADEQRLAAALEKYTADATRAVTATQGLAGAQSKAGQAVTAVGAASGGASRLAAQFGFSLSSLAGPLAGLVGGAAIIRGITSALREGSQSATEFGRAMAEVSTIVEGVPIEALAEDVRALAIAQGLNETVVARGLYEALSAGIEDAAQATQFLAEANRLAVGGVASTAQAVDLLTTIINAYALQTEDAARISDVLFETVRIGKTTIPELADTIGRVIPVAAALGVSVEEVSAAIATLTKGGLDTDIATTSLRGVFNALLAPGEQAKQTLAEFGIDISRSRIESEGFATILREIKDRLGDDQQALARIVPDVRALTGVLALAGNQADEFERTLAKTFSSSGAAQEAFTRQFEAPVNTIDRASNAISVTLSRVFTEVQAGIARVIREIEKSPDLLRLFGDVGSEAFEILSRSIREVADLFVEAVRAINEISAAINNLSDFLERLRQQSRAVDVLVGGIEALRGGINLFGADIYPATRALRQFNAIVGEDSKQAVDTFHQTARTVGQALTADLDGALVRVDGSLKRVNQAFVDSSGSVKLLASSVTSEIASLLQTGQFEAAAERVERIGTAAEAARGSAGGLSLALSALAADGGRFAAPVEAFQELVRLSDSFRGSLRISGDEIERFDGFVRNADGAVKALFAPATVEDFTRGIKSAQLDVLRIRELAGDRLTVQITPEIRGDVARREIEAALAELRKFSESGRFLLPNELPESVNAALATVQRFTDVVASADALLGRLFQDTADGIESQRRKLDAEIESIGKAIDELQSQGLDDERIAELRSALEEFQRFRLGQIEELAAKEAEAEGKKRRDAQRTIAELSRAIAGLAPDDALDPLSKGLAEIDEKVSDIIGRTLQLKFEGVLDDSQVNAALDAIRDAAARAGDALRKAFELDQVDRARERIALLRDVLNETATIRFGEIAEIGDDVSELAERFRKLAEEAGLSVEQVEAGLSKIAALGAARSIQANVDLALRPRVSIKEDEFRRAVEDSVAGLSQALDDARIDFQAVFGDPEASAEEIEAAFQRMQDAANALADGAEAAFERSTRGLAAFKDGFSAALSDIEDAIGNDFAAGVQLANGVVNSFTGSLSDAFESVILGSKSADEAFKDFLRSFIAGIGKAISQLLVFKIAASILGGLGFGGFGGGAAAETAAAFPTPRFRHGGILGATGILPTYNYQVGGVAHSPQVAVFGEAGPEAFVPLPGPGRGIPVEFKRPPSGGPVVNITINASAIDTRGMRQALQAEAKTIADIVAGAMSTGESFALTESVRSLRA